MTATLPRPAASPEAAGTTPRTHDSVYAPPTADDYRAATKLIADLKALGETINKGVLILGVGGLLFTAINVTLFAIEHDTSPWIAWMLDPLVSLALLLSLHVDGVLLRLGATKPKGWPLFLRWFAFLSTWLMNTWPGLFPKGMNFHHVDYGGVMLHSVIPVLVLALSEASAGYRKHLAARIGLLEVTMRNYEAHDHAQRETDRAAAEQAQRAAADAEREDQRRRQRAAEEAKRAAEAEKRAEAKRAADLAVIEAKRAADAEAFRAAEEAKRAAHDREMARLVEANRAVEIEAKRAAELARTEADRAAEVARADVDRAAVTEREKTSRAAAEARLNFELEQQEKAAEAQREAARIVAVAEAEAIRLKAEAEVKALEEANRLASEDAAHKRAEAARKAAERAAQNAAGAAQNARTEGARKAEAPARSGARNAEDGAQSAAQNASEVPHVSPERAAWIAAQLAPEDGEGARATAKRIQDLAIKEAARIKLTGGDRPEITGAQLGALFGMKDRWGQERIAEAGRRLETDQAFESAIIDDLVAEIEAAETAGTINS